MTSDMSVCMTLLITEGVIDFMSVLDTREIHGYDASRGYRVLK